MKQMIRIFRLAMLMALVAVSGNMFSQKKLTGTTIFGGSVSTNKDYAFDGRLDTYFATYDTEWSWVGLDLGSPHIILQIGYAPRDVDYGPERMVLGVFEGANSPDFMDAVPLFLIRREPKSGEITYTDVKVSRGFRYVRYVTPNGGKCNIAEMELYGVGGEGDDSHFYQVTGLPTVSIHVKDNVNPPNDKTDYASNITITYENGTLIQEYPIKTRVRGNFSATWENKPYRIKFDDDKKHHMLKGSPEHESPAKAKKWTLISSFGDKTLMRNPVAYEISKRVGLPFSPWCKPVDLILNGEYRGTYQLTDHVDIKSDRVNITEMTADDIEGDALTGGYLIEMNGYAGGDPVNFTSLRGNPVSIHSPEDDVIQPVQKQYIVNHFNEMENRVFAENYADKEQGYRSQLDLTTFLKYFLSNEFSSNTDYLWQVYMYKQRGDEHIYTGPVWDNDLSLENDGNYYPGNQCDDWVYKVRGAGSWRELVTRVLSDGNAMAQLKTMWTDLRKREIFTADNIADFVDSLRIEMAASADLNFKRWPYLNQQVHCNPKVYGTWDAEVDNVRDYVYGRVGWMDNMLSLSLKKKDGAYQISNGYELCLFANLVNEGENDARGVITSDIDMTDYMDDFNVIGSRQHPFRGTLDGQKHRISNLRIIGNDTAGLFGCISGGARIENIFIDASSAILATNNAGAIAGIVTGSGEVTMSIVGNEAPVSAVNEYAGGLVGRVDSNDVILRITNAYNTGSVTAFAHAAGLVAFGGGGLALSNCYNIGKVEGAITGFELADYTRGNLTNCYGVNQTQITALTDEMVSGGELCYKLNDGGAPLWRQNIDNGRKKDAFPIPLTGHSVVFEADGRYTNINPNAQGFQYYMLRINDASSVIQMSEFDLLDATAEELATLQAYNCNKDGFGSENWNNLTDNNVNTKYCASFSGDTYIMFDAGEQFDVYGYRIYTANDTQSYPERNPRSWKLYGTDTYTTNADDVCWNLIDEVYDDHVLGAANFTPFDYMLVRAIEDIELDATSLLLNPEEEVQLNALITPRTMAYTRLEWTSSNDDVATVSDEGLIKAIGVGEATVTVSAPGYGGVMAECKVKVTNEVLGYRYYLWEVEGSQDASTIQMAEFALIDGKGEENEQLSIYLGTESNVSNENWPNLVDHSVSTKFCSGGERAPFYFYMDAQKRMRPMAYRIYTANDTETYSSRNPRSWRLWGSNEHSTDFYDKCWTLIDEITDDNVLGATNFTPYDYLITWPEEPDGIVTYMSTEDGQRFYDPVGRQIMVMRRGLNIVKTGDGKVRKIIVR